MVCAQNFIEPIDAIDNGISQYDPALGLEPKYKNRTDLSSRVGWLNPEWNESVDAKEVDVSFIPYQGKSCDPDLVRRSDLDKHQN